MRSAVLACVFWVASVVAIAACIPQSQSAPAFQVPFPTASAIPTQAALSTPSVEPAATSTLRPSPAAATVTVSPTAATDGPAPVSTPTSLPSIPAPTVTRQREPAGSADLTVGLLRLRNDLDDPLGYCIDVRGFGSGIRLDADLQAHSCKSGSPDDQSFAMFGADPRGGILLFEYGVCVAVADLRVGASVLLRECDDDAVHREFEWLDAGRLRVIAQTSGSQLDLCVGVAGGSGEPAGGRNHLRRDLLLRDCDGADPSLVAWRIAKP